MKPFLVQPASAILGRLILPGDKSIASRAVILSSLVTGSTLVENFPSNQDCLYTVGAFRKLGVQIKSCLKTKNRYLEIFGRGLGALKKPELPLFVGDSGTTLRLLLGVLTGCDFRIKIITAKSLAKRPMLRVTAPLRMMGANIACRRLASQKEEYPPIVIQGNSSPRAINYKMTVASAQVKSAILLAGLKAKGITKITEPLATRDHTERMLKFFKADIKTKGKAIFIKGDKELHSPGKIYLPADISSASFFMVLAAILPRSKIVIKKVSLNTSRLGIVRALRGMGANITIISRSFKAAGLEPLGDIKIGSSNLKAIRITKKDIPSLIDELPILMVAACFAKGKSVFEGIEELRVKETDRINSMCCNLKRMGADIKVQGNKAKEIIVIRGLRGLKGCSLKSFGDHRTAMSIVVAALAASGKSLLDDVSCINKSFPEFLPILKGLLR